MKLNKTLENHIRDHAAVLNGNVEKLEGFFRVISEFYDLHEKKQEDRFPESENTNQTVQEEGENREAFFGALIENAHDGIVLVDADGKIKFTSPSVARIFGYTPDELLGIDPATLLHPDDKENILGLLQNLLPRHSAKEKALYRMRDKKGDWRWIRSRITNLLHLPYVQALVFNYEDATELIQAESELQQLFDNIKEVFFSVDIIHRKTLQISPACRQIYGYEPKAFFDDPDLWFKMVLDEDKAIIQANYAVMATGKSFMQEYRIRHSNGSIRWFQSKIFPTLDEKGSLVRIDGITADVTEKKTDTEKLTRSRSHLLASQHIARIGSWEIELLHPEDMPANPVFWSDETFRIFGYQPDEIIPSYDSYFSLVHPDDREKVWQAFAETLKTGATFSLEHRIIKADGEEITAYGRSEIETDTTGKPIRVIGTVQDISERKKAESLLKQTEANFRNILENTDTSYVLLDTSANILEHNHRAVEFGKRLGVYISKGANYIDLMPESRREEVRTTINGVLSENRSVAYEVEYPDNTWLYVRMHPILNADKTVLGLSSAATDITQIKNAEKQLKESNIRYELVTRATNDIIWDWDIVSGKIYRSENYEDILGYKRNENNVYTDSWLANIHPEDKDKVLKSVAASTGNAATDLWEQEYRYYRNNGEIAYIHDRGYIQRDERNRPVRIVGAMMDVTAKKLAAIEHDKLTNDLIQRNKDLEQFAYIVSHNLRAPVANIMGFADAFIFDDLDPAERQIFNQGLSTSVRKLDAVITDLNHILQIKREINEMKTRVVFSELVNDISVMLRETMRTEQVSIVTDFSACDEMQGLKSYLHSIFYNLISNSIKYRSPDRSLVIEIKSRKTPGGSIVLSFNDNGLGIDLKRKADQVFGLYKRFHLHIEGKGMGLYMTKTQVEAMGGKIKVQSEVDEGTEFIIEFAD